MTFYADLHVHSRYSRATSRNCDLEHLALWGRKKGIRIVATGDFTHPAWRAGLKEKLVPAEPGLFRLRPDLERAVEERLPPACRSASTAVRFMLSVEISTIYKKLDRTRKIHHLIYTPDFDSTDRVVASLSRIGNLHSDGRPILGLDSRHLLEIALESGPDSYLVPAHIWTPWFAALGSKSGFDAIDDCYGDLAPHIFAVETGLSSDPPMNWRVSSLDRFRLVSNSDAHSPEKLGREVCVFDTEPDYFALRRALETGDGYGGTLEFFPEEGKYHLDGHRHCRVRLSPGETRAHDGLCPACGRPLTVGVMHRVEDLADRPGEAPPPRTAGAMQSLVPLPEILSEIHQVGAKSKRVAQHYESLLGRLGPELPLLAALPLEDIAPASSSLVAEAVSRLRRQEVIRQAGYDGVYGTIRLFEAAELHRRTRGASLFGEEGEVSRGRSASLFGEEGEISRGRGASLSGEEGEESRGRARRSESEDERSAARSAGPDSPSPGPDGAPVPAASAGDAPASPAVAAGDAPAPSGAPRGAPSRHRTAAQRAAAPHRRPAILTGLDDEQRRAVETVDAPLLVVAGPGSGKTRTLTRRIAHLVTNHGADPARCLAITFTRRAAGEMRDRLRALLPGAWERVALHTFHSLGLSILSEHHNAAGLQRGFRVASEAERVRLLRDALGISERRARSRLSAISRARRTGGAPPEEVPGPGRGRPRGSRPRRTGGSPPEEVPGDVLAAYEGAMEARNLCDFDDLVLRAADALESDPGIRAHYRRRYRWISVDEYQDVDEQQVRLLKQLVSPDGNLCAIGDPDQAIYGFRGADVRFFSEFRRDFPETRVVRLTRNYRSERNIVALSAQVIGRSVSIPETGPGSPPGPLPGSGLDSGPGSGAGSRSGSGPGSGPGSGSGFGPGSGSGSGPGSGSGFGPGSGSGSGPGFGPGSGPGSGAGSGPGSGPGPGPGSGLVAGDAPDLVTLHEAPTDRAEAEFIVQSLEQALGGHSFFSIDSGRSADGDGSALSFSDFAVLYRTEAQIPALAEALRRSGMPFQHRSHRLLLEHPGVAAALDALRESPGPGSVAERLEAACPGGGRRDPRMLEARELLRPAAVACGGDLERFLSDLALGTEADTWDPRADRISLLTLHAAKGLEFPVVFIAGCENGLLPLAWGRAGKAVLAEERRLFYVGVTRARSRLYLCRARKRLWRGKVRELPPSPYLADIEEQLLERRRARIPARKPKTGDDQLDLFT